MRYFHTIIAVNYTVYPQGNEVTIPIESTIIVGGYNVNNTDSYVIN